MFNSYLLDQAKSLVKFFHFIIMRKYLSPIALIAIAAIFYYSLMASTPATNVVIATRHEERFNNFKNKLNKLEEICANYKSTAASKIVLVKGYQEVRKAFKKWEYLAEHLDYIFIKDQVNGAPLPKLEKKSFGLNILQPKGLQVIDELIFADSLPLVQQELLVEIKKLQSELYHYQTPQKIYDKHVFEASRVELIRLFTLGFTGFDTPGSVAAIDDAMAVIKTIQEDLKLYETAISKKDKNLAKSISRYFADFSSYLLLHQDFDKLDRMYVLKQFVNPLFKNLLLAHQALEIEMPSENGQKKIPFNYLAINIFDKDFLDYTAYITVPTQFLTEKTKTLGRTLFFDPLLSADNEMSCSSCHQPEKGFTDQLPKSIAAGHKGTVDRNSPTLLNCVYSERFFLDLRANSLEEQTAHVFSSANEFNMDILKLLKKLEANKEYTILFKEAFTELKDNALSNQTIQFALSAYVSSLRAHNSVFDKYVRGEIKTISPDVVTGFNLFMGKAACGSCHFAPIFNGTVPPMYLESESEVLGVPANPNEKPLKLDADKGRAVATLRENSPFYEHSFKTVSVRNVALTAPYMHNGAYKTLAEVMDFYNEGGGKGLGLDVPYQTLSDGKLNLNKQEIAQIISFMNALTDTSGLTRKPSRLPQFEGANSLNNRKIGGNY